MQKDDDITVMFSVSGNSYRKTAKDFVYFNSDLNKFIGEECEHSMTSIDIDLAQFKKSRGIIRIAESKHLNESIGYQQNSLLEELAQIAEFINKSGYRNKDGRVIQLEVDLIRGNYPYGEIQVKDYITSTTTTISGDNVKKYLTLEA